MLMLMTSKAITTLRLPLLLLLLLRLLLLLLLLPPPRMPSLLPPPPIAKFGRGLLSIAKGTVKKLRSGNMFLRCCPNGFSTLIS